MGGRAGGRRVRSTGGGRVGPGAECGVNGVVGRGQQVQMGQGKTGVTGRGFHDRQHLVGDPGDRVRLVPVGAVVDEGGPVSLAFPDVEGEVEPAGGAVDRQRSGGQAGEGDGGRLAVEDQHRPEQGVVLPWRGDRGEDVGQGDVGVVHRVGHHPGGVGEQVAGVARRFVRSRSGRVVTNMPITSSRSAGRVLTGAPTTRSSPPSRVEATMARTARRPAKVVARSPRHQVAKRWASPAGTVNRWVAPGAAPARRR